MSTKADALKALKGAVKEASSYDSLELIEKDELVKKASFRILGVRSFQGKKFDKPCWVMHVKIDRVGERSVLISSGKRDVLMNQITACLEDGFIVVAKMTEGKVGKNAVYLIDVLDIEENRNV